MRVYKRLKQNLGVLILMIIIIMKMMIMIMHSASSFEH